MAYAAATLMSEHEGDEHCAAVATDPDLLRNRSLRRTDARGSRWRAGIASLILHSAVAIALIASPSLRETGAIETATEAISVELVASAIVEQADARDADAAAALPAATAANDGATSPVMAASAPAETATAKDVPSEPVTSSLVEAGKQAETVISGLGPEAEIQSLQSEQEPQRNAAQKEQQAKDPRETTDQRRTPAKKPDKGQARETQVTGGVRVRGASAAAQSGGRVSASAGAIVGYAAKVRSRVASNRPSVGGKGGTAVVSFGVTTGGGLAYARLARSSGMPALDQAALAAVRRSAPFPPPPSGATARQLAFSIPFHFR
jgi:protein TonB